MFRLYSLVSLSCLSFLALVNAAPCYTECKFRFCNDQTGFKIGMTPGISFTSAVCAKNGTGIGRVGHISVTGEPRIARRFDSFGISALAPAVPFSKSFFKPFNIGTTSITGIGHEAFVGRQPDILQDQCVILPITSYQILDASGNAVKNVGNSSQPLRACVAFKVLHVL